MGKSARPLAPETFCKCTSMGRRSQNTIKLPLPTNPDPGDSEMVWDCPSTRVRASKMTAQNFLGGNCGLSYHPHQFDHENSNFSIAAKKFPILTEIRPSKGAQMATFGPSGFRALTPQPLGVFEPFLKF